MDDLDKRRWERLLCWLRDEHGMDVSEGAFHVEARRVPGAGRGLFAMRDCPPSTELFKIPATALLNKKTVSALYPDLRKSKLSAIQIVSLHLFLHRPSGEDDSADPRFGPYISTLPRDFSSHPLSWLVSCDVGRSDPWEAQLLGMLPPAVSRQLKALRDRFWEDWRTVASTMVRAFLAEATANASLSAPAGSIDSQDAGQTMDYLWAWLNVNTRCIYYRLRNSKSDPDNLTLCPVLDFANHSHGRTHIYPVIDSDIWSTVTMKTTESFIFLGSSQSRIAEGQELYLQYGGHSNAFLFAEYGFVNSVNAEDMHEGYPGEVDVEEILAPMLAEKSPRTSLRSVLEAEGYWGDWTLHSAPTPAHPSYRLTTALRLLHAVDHETDGPGLETALAAWRAVVNGQAEPTSEANEDRWRRTLAQLCDDLARRARKNMEAVSAMTTMNGEELDTQGWKQWMVANVELLWTEEEVVAEAVAASVRAGVEF
ncbi:SET domain-containing protein [Epithele typhae]|uniref:SET domain-containing protein n=1 Tax=Epithele typhae TaxID=378194 RepID=UPI002008CF7F|nr:SET domain-containing protein [Epithele typhae]KAH9946169.1 SET domain-containing protein [Epithele typhae]